MKLSPKRFKKLLVILMLLAILYNIASTVYENEQKFFTYDYWHRFPVLKQTYLDSQYVNKHPKAWIPDEAVNAYAGGAYIKGVSPILIAPDTPPLGRYLIGLSALVSNNENGIILLCAIGSLALLYLLSMQVFHDTILSLIPPLLVSFEQFFTNQLVYAPLLDIIQLFLLLCSFYFFNKGFTEKRSELFSFTYASFFLGAFIATKFYITGVTIIFSWFATLLLYRKIELSMKLLVTLPLAVIILLASYARVLFDHYSLLKFLGIQKYVLLYHKSQLIYPFSIWPLLLFNRWYVWFGSNPIISDSQWRITWPLVTIVSLLSCFLMAMKKVRVEKTVLPLLLWTIIYILFFSVGQISSRYFIILIPVMYIVALYGVWEVIRHSPFFKKFHLH